VFQGTPTLRRAKLDPRREEMMSRQYGDYDPYCHGAGRGHGGYHSHMPRGEGGNFSRPDPRDNNRYGKRFGSRPYQEDADEYEGGEGDEEEQDDEEDDDAEDEEEKESSWRRSRKLLNVERRRCTSGNNSTKKSRVGGGVHVVEGEGGEVPYMAP